MNRKGRDSGDFDKQYFQRLVRCICSHDAWQVSSETFDPEILAEQAVSHPVEFWFDHTTTNSVLRFNMPSRDRDYAAEATLTQAFVNLERSNSEACPFLNELSEAHRRIAAEQRTENYVSVLSDSTDILKITIPDQYTQATVYEALDAADHASKKTQRLHDETLSFINNFI